MDDVFDGREKDFPRVQGPSMTYHVVVQRRAERDIHLAAHWIRGRSGSQATALRWARKLCAAIVTLKVKRWRAVAAVAPTRPRYAS
jgi:hypothetical protein